MCRPLKAGADSPEINGFWCVLRARGAFTGGYLIQHQNASASHWLLCKTAHNVPKTRDLSEPGWVLCPEWEVAMEIILFISGNNWYWWIYTITQVLQSPWGCQRSDTRNSRHLEGSMPKLRRLWRTLMFCPKDWSHVFAFTRGTWAWRWCLGAEKSNPKILWTIRVNLAC